MKKKLFALLLAAMTLTAGLSASAISFSDDYLFTHDDAIYGCVEKGIINGFPDGTYRPFDTLTRAQLCAMLARAISGAGNFPTMSSPSFSDIRGHWAEGYIEYCADLDIVAGMGDGSFRPDATLTAVQASKMIMVAVLGVPAYNYVGRNWADNVNVDAYSLGLYYDLDHLDPNDYIDREDTAYMLWHCLCWEDWIYFYNDEISDVDVTSAGQYWFDLFYYGKYPTDGFPWYDVDQDLWLLDGEPYTGGLYGK